MRTRDVPPQQQALTGSAEALLRTRHRQQQAVAELGLRAIVSDDLTALFDEAVQLAAQMLGAEYADVLEALPGGAQATIMAALGWSEEPLVGLTIDLDPQAAYTLAINEPVVTEDLLAETRFSTAEALRRLDIRSGIAVVVRDRKTPFGVLRVHSKAPRSFSNDEAFFLRSIANVLGLAIQRQRSLEALRKSEASHRSLAESTPASVSVTSADGKLEFVNHHLLEYLGLSEDEARRGEFPADLFHPDDVARDRERWEQARAAGTEYTSEFRVRHRDGAYRWNFGRMVPVRNDAGEIDRWISVSIDIHDRKNAEEAALRTAEELRKASAAKDEFLALVSHELRTPVTTIYGNVRILRSQREHISPDDIEIALEDVEAEAERLRRIIENLLVLARFQTTDEIETEPMPLRAMVSEIVDAFRARNPLRQIDLTVDPAAPRLVTAQPTYFELVMNNLLSNAAKYSPPDTLIEVNVTAADSSAEIRVLDRGSGLRPDEIEELFSPFYRSDATREHSGGVGIGLAVCKRLMEAQGSRIWAKPRPGGGAEFGFTLPAEDAPAD